MARMSEVLQAEVFLGEIQAGMRVKEDAINEMGNVVVAAGTVIHDPDRVRQLLHTHGIDRIRIVIGEAAAPQEPVIEVKTLSQQMEERVALIKKQQMIATVRDELQQVQKKLVVDFDRILTGEEVSSEEIRGSIKKTLEIFNQNMNVFQLIEKLKEFDDITYAHSQNVTIVSYALGKWLNLNQYQMEQLTTGAMLIDIGKIQIPRNILNKTEPLTHDEILECRKHAIYSHDLIKDFDFISNEVKQIVLYHHERVDGSGYPLGLKGERIPTLAKIVAIADIYNALTSERPYRGKFSPFKAIKILEKDHRESLDAKILYVFLNRIGQCFVGQRVKLKDNRIGEIVFVSNQNIYRPMVKLERTGEIINLNEAVNAHLEVEDFI